MSLPDKRAFWAIAKKAEASTRRMARELEYQIAPLVRSLSKEVGEGRDVGVPLEEFEEALFSLLVTSKIKWTMPLAIDGFKIAGTLLGRKTCESYRSKEVIIDTAAWGADSLVAAQLAPRVGEWIEVTSKYESATSSTRLGDIVRAGINEGYGPGPVAQKLLVEDIASTKSRSVLMARTATNWSYNEGATRQYVMSGFSEAEWSATDDDALCEFCMAMDGRVFRLEQTIPSLSPGDTFTGNDGGSMTVGLSVEHPPLHPHCRCTILPNIGEL